jgi:hypothetical protein
MAKKAKKAKTELDIRYRDRKQSPETRLAKMLAVAFVADHTAHTFATALQHNERYSGGKVGAYWEELAATVLRDVQSGVAKPAPQPPRRSDGSWLH